MNKWDAVEKQTGTLEEFSRKIRTELKFMDYAPVLFLSALTGQRVHKLMGMVRAVHEQATRRITTGLLNDVHGRRAERHCSRRACRAAG